MIIDLSQFPFGAKPEEPCQLSADALASPLFYVQFNRWMTRQWKHALTGAEAALLDFVFDRTVGWSKQWERISLRQFASGFAHEGGPVTSTRGTGLCVQSILNALRSLHSKGVLLVRDAADRQAPTYSINFNWTPDSKTPSYSSAMQLRLSKNHRPPPAEGGESALKNRAPCSKKWRSKREEGKESQAGFASQTGRAVQFDALVQDIVDKSKVKREAAKQRDLQSAASLEMRWREAWTSAFPDTPPMAWKQREGFAVQQWAKRYARDRMPSMKYFPELLEWVVSRWRVIMQEQFRGFRNAPEYPTPGFAVKFSDRFESAFLRRAELERRASMTSRENIIASAKDRGMDADAAAREADERLGLVEQKEALNRERLRLKAQQATAVQMPPALAMAANRRFAINFKKPSLSELMSEAEAGEDPFGTEGGES